MNEAELKALHERCEAAEAMDDTLADAAARMLEDRLEGKLTARDAKAALLAGTDGAVNVVGHAYPGWALSFDGHASKAPNTVWRCTLKETRGPDDDQLVGIGNAKAMPLALLAAVAHLKMMHMAGYR